MKPRRSLSIDSIAHGDRHRAMAVCTGTADSVALTSAVLPAALSMCPFQPGMRAAILSTSGYSSDLLSLYTERGMPR